MWKCPKCNREFLKINQSHSCVNYPLDKHFKGKEEIGKPLFYKLVERIEKDIGPLKIESLPCCIHLLSNYTFSGVWIGKDKIKIDFRLDKMIDDKRILKQLQMSPNRYLYYLEIKNEDEIDDKLIVWIRSSYNANIGK
jgi:hypothetical protein